VDDGRNENPGKKGKPGGRKIGKILIPGVAHRRMDIADMESIRMRDDSLSHTMGSGDNKVIVPQVEKLCSKRKEGQIEPVSLLEKREFLKKACPYFLIFDFRNLAPLKMEKSVDRSLRENLSQNLENLFSPSLAGQPIMNKGNFSFFHCGDYKKGVENCQLG